MNEVMVRFYEKVNSIQIEENDDEYFFMIDAIKALIPPHSKSKNLLDNGFLTFFVEVTGTIALGIVSNYIYDLIKNRKIKEIKINGKKIEITNENISIKIIEGELNVKDS